MKEFIIWMERLSKVRQYCMISGSYSGQFMINCRINEAGICIPGALWDELTGCQEELMMGIEPVPQFLQDG